MNRYQKQRSKEIKQLMKFDNLGLATYSQARRHWNRLPRFTWISPCSYCYSDCPKRSSELIIAYCPDLFTIDMRLNRALRLLPLGIATK